MCVVTGEDIDKRASATGIAAGRKAGWRRREEKPRLGAWVLTGERVDKRASATGVAAGGKAAGVSVREYLRCKSRASGKVVLIGATAERGRIGGGARGFCGIGQKKRGAVK